MQYSQLDLGRPGRRRCRRGHTPVKGVAKLDMLKAKRAQLKKEGKKGFTLMEMLIVVAIIAVLVAIMIPVMSAQLEKSRDAASVANLRSAYAEAQSAYLTQASTDQATYNPAKAKTDTTDAADANVVVKNVKIECTNSASGHNYGGDYQNLPEDLQKAMEAGDGQPVDGTFTLTFTYHNDSLSTVTFTKQ